VSEKVMKKFQIPQLSITGFLLAAIAIVADQVSKYFVLDYFRNGAGQMELAKSVTPFFDLVLVWNRGVSFGMFNQHGAVHENTVMPYVLIALAVVLVAFVTHWLLRAETRAEAIAFGLIIGGAIGNVIDRIRLGAVVDFLDFHLGGWHYPSFNVADSAIVVGAGIILFLWGLRGKTGA